MECGYYQFESADTKERYGSFEVFEIDSSRDDLEPGYYWHACFPGCLPDGGPEGPFDDPSEAYEDAMAYGCR